MDHSRQHRQRELYHKLSAFPCTVEYYSPSMSPRYKTLTWKESQYYCCINSCQIMITLCWWYLLNMKWMMYGILFLHLSTFLKCFCPRTTFAKRLMGNLSRTLSIAYLNIILRTICRSFPGLTTEPPCGLWDRGWTNCLLYDGPFLGLGFLSVSWCVSLIEGFCFWFIASIHVLSNTRFFLLCFLLNHFTLKQFSYAKYFVLSFSIDEVATPANCILIYFLANYHVGWNRK